MTPSPGPETRDDECIACGQPVIPCRQHPVSNCHVHRSTGLHICSWDGPLKVATPRKEAS